MASAASIPSRQQSALIKAAANETSAVAFKRGSPLARGFLKPTVAGLRQSTDNGGAMKKLIVATTLLALLGSTSRAAEESMKAVSRADEALDHRFGAGLILGEPIGVSLKYWLSEKTAIDGALAWSFRNEDNFEFHTDFLFHEFDWVPVSSGKLLFYFGGGLRVKLQDNDDDRFGIRGPVGVSYLFDEVPVDIFVEVGPVIDFTPRTRGGVTGGIGARYWF